MNPEDLDIAGARLSDWHWRMNNLYYIMDKRGRKTLFRLNWAQRALFKMMWFRTLVLKCRQTGITTAMMIFMLDAALFRPNTLCGVIAHTKPDAAKLFREKIKFAYDCLPDALKEAVPAKNDRAGELVFANGSAISVGVTFRGGTLRYLHVSEFGKICAKFPERAREIVTGAFESVGQDCVITIESTAEGRAGYFFDYSQQAEKLKLSGRTLTKLDFSFVFLPWWEVPEYRLQDASDIEIPQRLFEYAARLKLEHGIDLGRDKLAWYFKKEEVLGDDMKREYPSTPGEAFAQSIEGAYYKKQFRRLYELGRITSVPHDPALVVHTIWDIGYDDSTAIWFVQSHGLEWKVIRYYQNTHEGVDHYAAKLREFAAEHGYRYGKHLGPHDLAQHEWGAKGKTRKQSAREQGVDFTLVPMMSIADGIEAARRLLPLCWFDETACDPGLGLLEAYRKEWDAKAGGWKDRPLHNESSHPADAFRYLATGIELLTEDYERQSAPVATQQPVPRAAWT